MGTCAGATDRSADPRPPPPSSIHAPPSTKANGGHCGHAGSYLTLHAPHGDRGWYSGNGDTRTAAARSIGQVGRRDKDEDDEDGDGEGEDEDGTAEAADARPGVRAIRPKARSDSASRGSRECSGCVRHTLLSRRCWAAVDVILREGRERERERGSGRGDAPHRRQTRLLR